MPAYLEGQLVVALSSRALFDFDEENRVFEDQDDSANEADVRAALEGGFPAARVYSTTITRPRSTCGKCASPSTATPCSSLTRPSACSRACQSHRTHWDAGGVEFLVDALCGVVGTRDDDFARTFPLQGTPQRLLLVVAGNISNCAPIDLFDRSLPLIDRAFVRARFVEGTGRR